MKDIIHRMIYLILTASLITNRFTMNTNREKEYVSAITETLTHLPSEIQPIRVENNGSRPTCLDHFTHGGKPVPVLYTEHNRHSFKSKGVNELLDLHAAIDQLSIQATDWIIKLTGRYRMTSSSFFDQLIQHEDLYDARVKFYNVDRLAWDTTHIILGCYAIRAYYLKSWNPYSIENYASAETAFAKYVPQCGARIYEMKTLGVRCHFAEDGRALDV
jgi:hypothetical protein